ncbi:hypothetical protein [Consotaella salsifontis]|uniref:Uncharacterized protein n=1 Tax=Consotaella salsifontis TaxID=1365950 RepID=A0A1T4T2D9_9HYPH|nr:hypothetical protein [Consotaella salsifontis]SKA34577.1 hypothetical protein SAMN05428963_11767 [Consotaella salsifontis]
MSEGACPPARSCIPNGSHRLNPTAGELLAGLCEVGMLAGLDCIGSVYDACIKHVYEVGGCEALRLAHLNV